MQNEPVLDGCEKRWILNRIVDPEKELKYKKLIESAEHRYHVIAFDSDAYKNSFLDASGLPEMFNPFSRYRNREDNIHPLANEWIIRHKSQQLINLNYARNLAITKSRGEFDWVLPFDGSCYFTSDAWHSFVEGLNKNPEALYGIIPIKRLRNHPVSSNLNPAGLVDEEPQIAFRSDAPDRFDEQLRYGHRNKSELLVRLGVQGEWENWQPASWDERPEHLALGKGRFAITGWVYRLFPKADKKVESHPSERWRARFHGVAQAIRRLNMTDVENHFRLAESPILRLSGLNAPQADEDALRQLNILADLQSKKRISKITDKQELPPSGDIKDYFSLRRFVHGIGDREVLIDGVSAPVSIIGSEESRQYDRTAFYECINQTTIMTVAGIMLENRNYLARAASVLTTWFIEQDSRMNPHAQFAQLNLQKPEHPNPYGLIDLRDLWLLPHLTNSLYLNGALSETQHAAIKSWSSEFLQYLLASQQGQLAFNAYNNIGTWVHLVATSLSIFTGEYRSTTYLINSASMRLVAQCKVIGMQFEELSRTRPLHYSLFNLTAWTLLANVVRSMDLNLWKYRGKDGESICRMMHFLQTNMASFAEFTDNEGKYSQWLDALVLLVPDTASGYSFLDRPKLHQWKDDPNTGLPPQWQYFLS